MLKHFIVKELVPPETWESEGEEAIVHFTPDILKSIEDVWFFFDTFYQGDMQVIINDWCFNGKFKYRGYRPSSYKGGSKNSQHRSGNAVDFDIYHKKKRIDPETIRTLIAENREWFPKIDRMEKKVNWIHIDCCKECDLKKIHLFNV
jgi:hypothetical protein